MRPSLLAVPLLAAAAGGGLAHAQPARDSAAYYRLLPSLADLPEGSQQVVQMQRDGSTFVRVFKVGDLAVNTALRLFDSPDSAAAYLTRFTISPQAFAAAAGEGLRSLGLVPDSVQADTLPLPGITAFHRAGIVARYYLPRGVFVMTQTVVANERYMILLQVGGADREDDIVSLIRRQASLADQRLGVHSEREPPNGR